jgi:hypothetical protein
MIEFADFSFHHSDPGDPSSKPPANFFSTLPFRTSKLKNEAVKGAEHAFDQLLNTMDSETNHVISVGGITERGHFVSWVYPEYPQDQVEQLAIVSEGIFYYDGKL